jgi:hypothetical protein
MALSFPLDDSEEGQIQQLEDFPLVRGEDYDPQSGRVRKLHHITDRLS